MEEDITTLESLKKGLMAFVEGAVEESLSNTMKQVLEVRRKQVQAIENLINKNKELEVLCEENQDEIEFLEKIIELMARYIEACTESCPLDLHNEEPRNDCENCGAGTVPYKCFIDYFRKKAKGE